MAVSITCARVTAEGGGEAAVTGEPVLEHAVNPAKNGRTPNQKKAERATDFILSAGTAPP